MKRIVCILTSIILSVSVFCSCGVRKDSTESVARAICEEIDFGGVLYSSLSGEGDDNYLPSELLEEMFLSPIPQGTEVTLVIRPSINCAYEVGVFYSPRSKERLLILELARERLALLNGYYRECKYAVLSRGGYIIYAFCPSADKVSAVLDSIF